MKNIFLIGFMGAGKSTIAKRVARQQKTTVTGVMQQLGATNGSINKFFDEDKALDITQVKMKNLGKVSDELLAEMVKGMEGVIRKSQDMGLSFERQSQLLERLKKEQNERGVNTLNANFDADGKLTATDKSFADLRKIKEELTAYRELLKPGTDDTVIERTDKALVNLQHTLDSTPSRHP